MHETHTTVTPATKIQHFLDAVRHAYLRQLIQRTQIELPTANMDVIKYKQQVESYY